MTLPTSVPVTPAQAFNNVLATARTVSTKLQAIQSLIAAGAPIPVDVLIGMYLVLNGSQAAGLEIQGVAGLPAYAQERLGNPDYDINAAFMTSVVACKACTDWLLEHLPSDGAERFVCWQVLSDGTMDRVTMPVNGLAELSNLIDAAQKTFD